MRRRKILLKERTDGLACGTIQGGFGNQMFIIFTTYSYALDNNLKPVIYCTERRRKTYFDTPIYKKIMRSGPVGTKVYSEKNHHYDPVPVMENIRLVGYFQSPKYFDHNKKRILELLELDKLRESIRQKYSRYLKNDIIIHFRLGDYNEHPYSEVHPVCDIEYYINALKNFDENSNVLCFFEEQDRATILTRISFFKQKFPKMSFNLIDTTIVDYEQVLLMSHFKNFVIANSSFSWWGAYLSDNKNKKVIYPSRWFKGKLAEEKKVHDMFFDDWIKI